MWKCFPGHWFPGFIRIHWILPRRYCPTPRHTGVSLRYFFELTEQFLKWMVQKMFIADLRLSHSVILKEFMLTCFYVFESWTKKSFTSIGPEVVTLFCKQRLLQRRCVSSLSRRTDLQISDNLPISFVPAIGCQYEFRSHVCGLHVGVPFDGPPNITGCGGQWNRDHQVPILQPGGLGQDI